MILAEQWYRQSIEDAESKLGVKKDKGLSDSDIKTKLEKFGLNELHQAKQINPFKLFASQFRDVLIVILILAAAVSGVLHYVEGGKTTGSPIEAIVTYEDDTEYIVSKEHCPLDSNSDDIYKYHYQEVCAGFGSGETVNHIETTIPSENYTIEYYDQQGNLLGAHEESDSVDLPTESLLIFAIVISIAIIGFLNEYKAEKTVEALRKLVGQSAKVRRNGQVIQIDAKEIVPGDVILFEEGQKIPADTRLFKVKNLKVNEASLTGESVPVSKEDSIISEESALGDQKNMLFSGTFITTGTAEGIVVTTGQNTELGKIATMVNEVEEEETPMQKKLDALGKKLGILIMIVCLVIFLVIFFADKEIADYSLAQRLTFAFTVAVALAVAAIPEGLSFVVRISLALGARRMADKNALVRKLSAVEALGSTDVICSDKTGTLTRGEMMVREMWANSDTFEVGGTGYKLEGEFKKDGSPIKDFSLLDNILKVGVLCNNAQIKEETVLGDPTEGALIVSAAKAGIGQDELNNKMPRVDEVPFTSERKLMTTIHKNGNSYYIATKGAVDVLVSICTQIEINGKVTKLDEKTKKQIIAQNENMAKSALRVLGFAYKETRNIPKSDDSAESDLIFAGLQGMMDPPRQEVKEVMHRVHSEAGMRVIMITGDHIETAKAVAKEIGIDGLAVTGKDVDDMSEEEFAKKVESISVYARVNPEHKIKIVKALKSHGHQVAMTGDGVNDAPAIKAADIGIAMGITGTDASKEAADLILLDDQFLTIINAIEEGRGIFDNVRKFVAYLLGANIAEVLVVLGGILLFQDPIYTATQLLFINIVTDGLPAVALGSDPAEKDIMRHKPEHFQEEIINKPLWIEMFIFGFVASALLLLQFWYTKGELSRMNAVSALFIGIVVYEIVRLVVLRLNYRIAWFSNIWLTVALVGSMIIQLGAVYIEPIADLFKVRPITLTDWAIIFAGSIVIFVMMKLVRRVLNTQFSRVKRVPQLES